MIFPYRKYEVEPTPGQGGATVIYRPLIPVRVSGNAGAANFYGLLDTGADETVLPRVMAEFVGVAIDSSKKAIIRSASGEMPVEYGEAVFEVGAGRSKVRWPAVVGIVDEPWEEAILGHAAFLRFFDATFLGEEREVRLKRNGVRLPVG